ncbi:MAG: hypothetical protein LC808_26685 [Actinobacteria bacterium]|nr:hypothetical protein [Actinomycetota bacterium]
MDLEQAARVHAGLAHALIGLWRACPVSQQVLQSELDLWSDRLVISDDEFFVQVADRLTLMGGEQAVIDALRVVQPAQPYLNAMFVAVVARARAVYEAHADWAADELQLRVALGRNSPYPDEPGFGELGAAACIPPRVDLRPSEVTLTLVPPRLGPPSWASVPYLLCHELVCHASQAADADSTDPFTEGWMDMVALELHDRWIDDVFPWDPAFAKEAGHRLSDVVRRGGPHLREPHMTTRGSRGTGWAAAGWVLGKIRPFALDSEGAWMDFECLSVQLNRLHVVPALHKSFVAKVNACQGDLALATRLTVVLRHWLAGEATPAEVFSFK